MSRDTIAALSTPPGTSGLAVVRVSGPDCRAALARCLRRPEAEPRRMYHARFLHPVGGETLDRLNFVFYAAPASPTGEDMLELFTHGNPLLVENVLRALIALPGLRLARGGEFTQRACENGKLDLVQAEGLMALVHAQSQAGLSHAGKVLDGALSRRLKALRERLIDLLVRLELDVDFVEEEADPDYASWRPRVAEALAEVRSLLRGHARGAALSKVPRVVLAGSPNAGKSSLINALLREERLLVSDRPGTTRDFVEAPLHLPSGLVHLVDTAGLGEAVDALDARAQEKTREQIEKADLVLWVSDGTSGTEEAAPWGDAPYVPPVLRIFTHADAPGFKALAARGAAPAHESGEAEVGSAPGFTTASTLDSAPAFAVGNPTGEGLPEVIAALEARLFAPLMADPPQAASNRHLPVTGSGIAGGPPTDDVFITTERQREALQRSAERLEAALGVLDNEPAIEILAFEVREAVQALRELLGEVTPDDVLHRLFAGFCIGK